METTKVTNPAIIEWADEFLTTFNLPESFRPQAEYFLDQMNRCRSVELRAMQSSIKNPTARKICRFILNERHG
jgi:hypothetical protein